MIDGRFAHQDSHGGGGLITDGATQWMTAGAGILHIETPRPNSSRAAACSTASSCGSTCPARRSSPHPDYQAIEGDAGGAAVLDRRRRTGPHHRRRRRWIARGPGSTHTPITLAHATIEPGAQLNLPWNRDFNALVYVLSGRGTSGPVAHPIEQGQLAVLGAGDRITRRGGRTARSRNRPAMEVLLLGGKPIREPVFQYGPFVMNSKSELIQALEDFESGRFGTVPPNALMPHRVRRSPARLPARGRVNSSSPRIGCRRSTSGSAADTAEVRPSRRTPPAAQAPGRR